MPRLRTPHWQFGTCATDTAAKYTLAERRGEHTWNHLCIVSEVAPGDSVGTTDIYWDGLLEWRVPNAMPARNTVHIGRRYNGESGMDALIDNVYMTNVKISAEGVAKLAQGEGMVPPSPPPTPLPPAKWAYAFEDANHPGHNAGSLTSLNLHSSIYSTDARFGSGALDFCPSPNSGCQGASASWFDTSGTTAMRTFSMCWFVKIRSLPSSGSPYLADWRTVGGAWTACTGGYLHTNNPSSTAEHGTCDSDSPASEQWELPAERTWTHICVVSDAAGTQGTQGTVIYMDGKRFHTMVRATPASGTVFVGSRYSMGSDQVLDGKIDNLWVSDQAIDAAQVKELFRGGGFD